MQSILENVVINKHIGKYDIVYDEKKNFCPMCEKYVKVKKVGFNRCSYKYIGI